jgi:hypothetical protein
MSARLRIFPPREQEPLAYSDARHSIRNGDVLLWRPTTFAGKLIVWFTGAEYSHASMAFWEPNGGKNPHRRLRSAELVQWHGGRHQKLSKCVRRYPGKIDVFRPHGPYNGDAAVTWIMVCMSQCYGCLTFVALFFRRVLGKRLLPLADSPDPDYPRVCSVGVAWAANYGGGRKVNVEKSDFEVLPGELAEPFSKYLGTLVPDPAGTEEAEDVAA